MNILYSTVIEIPQKHKTRALDAILRENLRYYKVREIKDGNIQIEISHYLLKKYKIVFEKYNVNFKLIREKGILSVVLRHKARFGLLLGAIILVFGVYFSSKIVWRIEIEGNNKLSEKEVLSILDESNFRIGTYIPSIDYDKMQNQILMNSDEISWVSLNVNGNIAKVQIKETLHGQAENEKIYSNIIASNDGQIAEIRVVDGERVVQRLDTVKKGDLLISGVIDSQSEGVRYARARGEVWAYVSDTIKIEIPKMETKKIYTGKVCTEKRLKLFSKELNFSLNYNKYNKNYDKIEKEECIKLFGKIPLPVRVTTVRYYEYKMQDISYDKEKMVDIALAQLRSELEARFKDAHQISKSVDTSYEEGVLTLICEISCIKNIAEEVKFSIK